MRRHKYNARKTKVDGIVFDSQREAFRYLDLKSKEQAGEISGLLLQPSFELQSAFRNNQGKKIRAIRYVADFQYTEDGQQIIEDTKGVETAAFKLKKKLFMRKFPELVLRIT